MRRLRDSAPIVAWVVVMLVGGCAAIEGLRQSAYVERLRAQDQQERAAAIGTLAAQSQEALDRLSQSLPADVEWQNARELIGDIKAAQNVIADRSSDVEGEASISEKWQTASSEVAGDPKRRLKPQTDEERAALRDFQERSHTVGRIRRAARGVGRIFRPGATEGQATSTGGSWGGALVGGLALTLLGGGGTLATLGRRAMKKITAQIESAQDARIEHSETERQREQKVNDLAEKIELMQVQMTALQKSLGEKA